MCLLNYYCAFPPVSFCNWNSRTFRLPPALPVWWRLRGISAEWWAQWRPWSTPGLRGLPRRRFLELTGTWDEVPFGPSQWPGLRQHSRSSDLCRGGCNRGKTRARDTARTKTRHRGRSQPETHLDMITFGDTCTTIDSSNCVFTVYFKNLKLKIFPHKTT